MDFQLTIRVLAGKCLNWANLRILGAMLMKLLHPICAKHAVYPCHIVPLWAKNSAICPNLVHFLNIEWPHNSLAVSMLQVIFPRIRNCHFYFLGLDSSLKQFQLKFQTS